MVNIRFLALLGLLCGTQVSAQRRVRMVDEASVRGAEIRLSDLLPETAGSEIRAAADRVKLGRAPLAGSVRVLTREQLLALVPSDLNIEIPEVVIVQRTASALSGTPPTKAKITPGLFTTQKRQTTPVAASVHRGQSATLLVESDGIRISEQVVALRTATAGETVSAITPTSHRIVHAVVIGKGMLQLQ